MLRPTSRLASGAASTPRWRRAGCRPTVCPSPSRLADLLEVERVDVGDVGEEAELEELAHPLLAEALDVHGAAAGEVLDGARPLRTGSRGLTQRVSASPSGRTSGARTGHGQSVGNTHSAQPFGPVARAPARRTSGMTSPALRTMTVSPGRTSLARTWSWLWSVATPTVDAADEHRLEHGERRGPAGAADRHLDVERARGALLGRELVGDGPPGRLGREAELALAGRGRRPSPRRRRSRRGGRGGAPASAGRARTTSSRSATTADLGVHREPERREQLERLVVASRTSGPPSTSPSW